MSSVSGLSSIYEPSRAPINPKAQLKSEDFISLLITQLTNQDPLQPMKNSDLLQQVSQIGTLQSQTALQGSLEQMVLQNQISSASGMIGRMVAGMDDFGEMTVGMVTSVRVVSKNVVLELDNGKAVQLNRVTDVGPSPSELLGGNPGGSGGNSGGGVNTGGVNTSGPGNPTGPGSLGGLVGGLNTNVMTPFVGPVKDSGEVSPVRARV